MGISSSIGLMSGLDIEGIIKATMNVERTPILRLQSDQAAFQAKISSYGSLKGVLSDLNSTVKDLTGSATFDAGYSASTSNKDMLTIETSDNASGGTYQIVVNQLATSAQMTGNAYTENNTDVGTGTLHFKVGDGDKQSVAISTDDQSLSGIATAINEANLDVTASVIKVADSDYRMTLTAKDTGKDIDFTFQEEGFTFSTTTQASTSTGEKMTSQQFDNDATALGITGTLSINGTDISLTGTENLNDIQASVDAIADISATVNYDATSGKYTLVVENDVADGNVTLNFSDTDATGGFSELIDNAATVASKKALVNINNIDVERESNSIDDLITGVTINLADDDPAETITVSVTGNYNDAKSKVESFVTAFNSATSAIDSLQSFNKETGQAGNLLGDSTANLLKSGLRRMLFTSVDGIDSSVNSLSNLGIEVQESGQLEFNSSTFTSAMESNPSDVTNFFTQETSGSEGLAVKFESFLDGYLDNNDGILAAKEDGYNNSISRMDNNIEAIERRLEMRENNLRQQFINLEELMANFTSTSSYLSNQLSVLSNMTGSFYK